ncbi:MAG: hypothetical protein Q8L81_13535 [Bacteroidota bacterium]|nr:hypothetical protein [Bacteroidota bacterium]
MLFDEKEFEHKIEESKLENGLKLFINNKLELINRAESNSFTFLIHGKTSGEISIRIKTGKILSYTCYCNNKNYCEHLAAANFYLQQEILKFEKPSKKFNKPEPTKKDALKKHSLQKHQNNIKTIIKPFLAISKLKNTQISEIYKRINFEQSGASAFRQQFYFHLAIILELPKLSNFNYVDKENVLSDLTKNSLKEIESYFVKGLDAVERIAFIDAARYSVRSQSNFSTGFFSFLISRASVLIKDKNDLEDLKAKLKKRKQNRNRLDPIDRKSIAEIQLSIMLAKLNNKTYSLKNYESTIELPIALAGLEFCMNRNDKGFAVLKQYSEKIKRNQFNKYHDLINEILIFAQEKNNQKIEAEFLIEKFIYGFVIDENELERFLEIEKDPKEKVEQLIIQLKAHSVFYTFEKIAVVLLHQNRLDELIEEIKKEKNKFRLLHKVAVQKFPDYDTKLTDLYVNHLVQAITDAKFPYFQEQIFNMAKQYLNRLHTEVREKMLEKMKEKLMYDRHMLAYISKIYTEI